MKLDESFKSILLEIDFIEEYKRLSDKYPYSKESFGNYSNDEIVKIISNFGYPVKYSKKENFFGVNQLVGKWKFTFNICCKYGIVELIWSANSDDGGSAFGGPWGLIGDLLLEKDCGIRYPSFKNYDDLELILKSAFEIFEKFKLITIEKLS